MEPFRFHLVLLSVFAEVYDEHKETDLLQKSRELLTATHMRTQDLGKIKYTFLHMLLTKRSSEGISITRPRLMGEKSHLEVPFLMRRW